MQECGGLTRVPRAIGPTGRPGVEWDGAGPGLPGRGLQTVGSCWAHPGGVQPLVGVGQRGGCAFGGLL